MQVYIPYSLLFPTHITKKKLENYEKSFIRQKGLDKVYQTFYTLQNRLNCYHSTELFMTKMLSTREVQKALAEAGVSYTVEYISNLIRKGYFPGAVKGPSRNSPWNIPEESLQEFIDTQLTRIDGRTRRPEQQIKSQ